MSYGSTRRARSDNLYASSRSTGVPLAAPSGPTAVGRGLLSKLAWHTVRKALCSLR